MTKIIAVTLVIAIAAFACLSCGDDSETPGPSRTPAPARPADPLAIAGAVTLVAADAGDAAAALAAGDFNGDGEIDVAYGAAFSDGPDNGRIDGGEVLVFLGPFELGETRDAGAGGHDAIVYGGDAGDQAGRALDAGDLNGDGIDDIIIGAPFGDGPVNATMDSGEVSVVVGSPDLGGSRTTVDLGEESDLLIGGPVTGALTGFSLAIGNLNSDEFADVVVSSFKAEGPGGVAEAGMADVIYGSASLPPLLNRSEQEADATVYGPSEGAWLGESVSVGDFDGDGLDDLALPAPFAPTLAGEEAGGRVAVVLSPLPPLLNLAEEDPDYIVYGADSGDQLGHSSATGDVDGDGRDDLLLGAVSSSGAGNAVDLAGEAVLVLGASLRDPIDVASGAQDAIAYGTAPTDRLGRSVALGDVDGDALADLLLGLPGADAVNPPLVDSGAVYLVPGGSGLPMVIELGEHGRVHFGSDAGDQLSNGVEGRRPLVAADVDGDSRDEILVSSSHGGGDDDAGVAYILFASPQ
jgi:hypothetical protein